MFYTLDIWFGDGSFEQEHCRLNRRIAGVKRVERRRMKDLREEMGTKACLAGKMVI